MENSTVVTHVGLSINNDGDLMSRFAPVVPVHMAESLQTSQNTDYLGSYHLLLAHDVIDRPDEYRRVYGRVRRRYSDSFIIMDNSIVELGEAMKIDDLLRACEIVPPDCLVVPDVMGDGPATRAKAIEFVRSYVRKAYEFDTAGKSFDGPSLLGVIQGETLADAMETYGLYYALPLVDFISVPRVITKQHGSRVPLLLEMQRLAGVGKSFSGLHLLGFSDNILDDVAAARMPFVQGIDSAVPIRAGLQGTSIDLHDPGWSKDLGPRGDFWDRPCDSVWEERLPTIHHNLSLYRRLIRSVPALSSYMLIAGATPTATEV